MKTLFFYFFPRQVIWIQYVLTQQHYSFAHLFCTHFLNEHKGMRLIPTRVLAMAKLQSVCQCVDIQFNDIAIGRVPDYQGCKVTFIREKKKNNSCS